MTDSRRRKRTIKEQLHENVIALWLRVWLRLLCRLDGPREHSSQKGANQRQKQSSLRPHYTCCEMSRCEGCTKSPEAIKPSGEVFVAAAS